MVFTEKMFDYVFDHIPQLSRDISVVDKNGEAKVVHFQTPRPRINYVEQIKKDSGIDVAAYTHDEEEQLRQDIIHAGHRWE